MTLRLLPHVASSVRARVAQAPAVAASARCVHTSAASADADARRLGLRRFADREHTQWRYVDTAGAQQGPFAGRDMFAWFLAGYLHDHALPVAEVTAEGASSAEGGDAAAEFVPLEQLLLRGPARTPAPVHTPVVMATPVAAPAATPTAAAAAAAASAAAPAVLHALQPPTRVAVALLADEATQTVSVQLRTE